jgi:flagellar biogenesis protein FliO
MKSNMHGKSTNVSVTVRKHGFMGFLFQMLTARRPVVGNVRKMQLVETLSLGGKRQLMLVQCGAEQFLVGGGLETVETIVQVNGAVDASRQAQGDLCR